MADACVKPGFEMSARGDVVVEFDDSVLAQLVFQFGSQLPVIDRRRVEGGKHFAFGYAVAQH